MFADFNFIKGTFVEINLFAPGVMKRMSNTLANQKCNHNGLCYFSLPVGISELNKRVLSIEPRF